MDGRRGGIAGSGRGGSPGIGRGGFVGNGRGGLVGNERGGLVGNGRGGFAGNGRGGFAGNGRGGGRPPLYPARGGLAQLPPLRAFAAVRPPSPYLPQLSGGTSLRIPTPDSSTGMPTVRGDPQLFPDMPFSQDVFDEERTAASWNCGASQVPETNFSDLPVASLTQPLDAQGVLPPLLSNGAGAGFVAQPEARPTPAAVPPAGEPLQALSQQIVGVAPLQTPSQALALVDRGRPGRTRVGRAATTMSPPPLGREPMSPSAPALTAIPAGSLGTRVSGAQPNQREAPPALTPIATSVPARGAGDGTECTVEGGLPAAVESPRLSASLPLQQRQAPSASAPEQRGLSDLTDGLMALPPPAPPRPRSRKRTASASALSGSRASSSERRSQPRPSASAPSSPLSPGSTASAGMGVTADEIAKLINDAVAKGVKDGLRSVQSEVAGVRQTCAAISNTLSTVCTNVNTQGIGTERTAVALRNLSGAVQGGFSSVMNVVESTQTEEKRKSTRVEAKGSQATLAAAAEKGDFDAMRKLADVNEANLKEIRKVYHCTLKKEMFSTDVSAKSFPSSSVTGRHRVNAVQMVMKLKENEAHAYLDSCLYYHVKRKQSAPVKRRVSSKLVLTLPHIFQAMKRLILPVYLNSINVSKRDLTSDICQVWKADCSYAKAPMARSGIAAAISTIYRKEGLPERIVKPTGVGQVKYVIASMGMYSMVSMLVRGHLDDIIAAAAKTKKKAGNGADGDDCEEVEPDQLEDDDDSAESDNDDGKKESKRMLYNTRWQAELVRMNQVLPRTRDVLHGLSLVDGDNPYRGVSRPPERETPEELSG